MAQDQRLELLKHCTYFAELSDDLLARLSDVAIERRFGAGEVIFFEGEGAGEAALHIVESGVVRIYKVSMEGREQVLRLMHAGDSFADVPAFDGGPYPANAAALEPSTVVVVPRRPLMDLMREHPEIALEALSAIGSRLRHLTVLVEDLSLRRVMSRVARLLQRYNGNANLSQAQMASMVGTGREMVNRSLNTLADRDIIEMHGSRITVLDPDGLDEVVESG